MKHFLCNGAVKQAVPAVKHRAGAHTSPRNKKA
jgi:hypothetical protein